MNRLLPFLSLTLAVRLTAADAPAAATAQPATGTATASPTDTGTNNAAKAAKEGQSTIAVDPATRELKPHDVLRFTIDEDPPLTGSEGNRVMISDGGEALFPISRYADSYVKVAAAGRKIVDIKKDVKALLDAEYYNNCTVSLDLERVNPAVEAGLGDIAKVTIYGSLNQMMQIGEGENLMLSEAILRAGGAQQGTFANLDRVRIHRFDPATKKETVITVNVNNVLRKGARDQDKQLQNGDRIEVTDKTFNLFN